MTPDRLLSAIRAALDDTERLALAAGERSRNWRAIGTVAVDHDGESPFPIVYDEGYPTEDEAEHIARHDPAAVLRWVAAMREIVALYEFVTGHGSAVDHVRAMDMTTGAESALRDVVRALARGLGIDPEETP
ncbi:MAG TPA: DUF6221 family protein [Jiangellales bacterium]|nr:DUF6221 family protein [Jiangellales bacterium]